jgi:hypothetical protein
MRSDRPAAREAYLRDGGDVCDVLVLAETNCVGGEQAERKIMESGRGMWLNGYETLWARGASDNSRLCCARYGCVCFKAPPSSHHTPGTRRP